MHKRDFVAIGSWIGIALLLWIVAWIIAEAIPVFSNLLSLIVCVSVSCNSGNMLTCPDRTLRQLVHVRLERDLLAVHEQGSLLLFTKEDCPDYSESPHCRYWWMSGMLSQPGSPSCSVFARLTFAVWSGSLCFRQGHPRSP